MKRHRDKKIVKYLSFMLVVLVLLPQCRTRSWTAQTNRAKRVGAVAQRHDAVQTALVSGAVVFGFFGVTAHFAEGTLAQMASNDYTAAMQSSAALERIFKIQNRELGEVQALLQASTGGTTRTAPSLPSTRRVTEKPAFQAPWAIWTNPHPDGTFRLVRKATDPVLSDDEIADVKNREPVAAQQMAQAGFETEQVSVGTIEASGQTLALSVRGAAGSNETHQVSVQNNQVRVSGTGIPEQILRAEFHSEIPWPTSDKGTAQFQVPGSVASSGEANRSSSQPPSSLRAMLEPLRQREGKANESVPLPLSLRVINGAGSDGGGSRGETEWILKTSLLFAGPGKEPFLRFDADLAPVFLPQSVKQEVSLIVPIASVLSLIDGDFEGPDGQVFIGSLESFSADYVKMVHAFYAQNPAAAETAVSELEASLRTTKQELSKYQDRLAKGPSIRNSAASRVLFLIAALAAVGAAGHEIGYQSVPAGNASRTKAWLESNGFR